MLLYLNVQELMQLIVSKESQMLATLHTEIKEVQQSVSPYANLAMFVQMDNDLKANTSKLEAMILETKQSKCLRGMQDYKLNCVYSWAKPENKSFTKIYFKKKVNNSNPKYKKRGPFQQRVNFSSTQMESSDMMSAVEDQAEKKAGS